MNYFAILKFFSKHEYTQMVSDEIQVPRLPHIYRCQRFPFHYQLSSKSELRVSHLLKEAVLLSFLIITLHPDVSSTLLWRAIFMINKLNFFSSTWTDGAFQCLFKGALYLLHSRIWNVNWTMDNWKYTGKEERTVWSLHQLFLLSGDLFSSTE